MDRTVTAGTRLVRELETVHHAIRRDLAECRALARSPDPAALGELRWRCLSHCRLVSLHHHMEHSVVYPTLQRRHPELAEMIEALESDHAAVRARVQVLRAAAAPLEPDERARARMSGALEALECELLRHLEGEERALHVALVRLRGGPG